MQRMDMGNHHGLAIVPKQSTASMDHLTEQKEEHAEDTGGMREITTKTTDREGRKARRKGHPTNQFLK